MNIGTLLNDTPAAPVAKRPRLNRTTPLPLGTRHLFCDTDFIPTTATIPKITPTIRKLPRSPTLSTTSTILADDLTSIASSCAPVSANSYTSPRISETSSFPSPQPPPTSSTRRNPAPARRLALSRLVGHRHRVTQREQTCQLQNEVDRLLQSQICLAKQVNASRPHFNNISATKYHLSNETTSLVNTFSITGPAALLLLQLIALRRNLFADIGVQTLECPPENVVHFATVPYNVNTLVEVQQIHEYWAKYEATTFYDADKSPLLKRCTRCGKARTAGSGHPRSTCDDGFKVGSLIQYRPVFAKFTSTLNYQ